MGWDGMGWDGMGWDGQARWMDGLRYDGVDVIYRWMGWDGMGWMQWMDGTE